MLTPANYNIHNRRIYLPGSFVAIDAIFAVDALVGSIVMDVIAHCANLVNEMPVNLMTCDGQHFAYVVTDAHRTYLFDRARVPFLHGTTTRQKIGRKLLVLFRERKLQILIIANLVSIVRTKKSFKIADY